MTDLTLGTFGDGDSADNDHTPDAVSIARCATTCRAPDRDGASWASPDVDWGLTTQRPVSTINTSASRAHKQQTRWVVDGDVGEYVAECGNGDLIQIPATYGDFDSIDTRVTFVDGLADSYGYGIDAQALEKALRVLTGGGRYTASKYSAILCGKQPWILTGPEGTLLCSCMPVERPESPPTQKLRTPETTLQIEEQNQAVLTGAAEFAHLLSDSLGVSIETMDYHSTTRDEARHSFVGEEDKFTIRASDLAQLYGLTTDPSVIQATVCRGVQPPNGGDTVSVEWDGPEHPVGYLDEGDVVAGYGFTWEQPDESLEDVAVVREYRITQNHSRWTVDYRTHRLTSVVP
ncbi:hypothetical protein [Haloarcula argentinensis]|uniref:hypothetical protein n=1 Tax=Haloarcula argentinensis TaxID=43776 RepID=UPI0002B255BC|nr:hypothetical protein [Haloarcula argentinensis]EMA25689.1 hypothetical protein C443_02729 [Haloarcula argentinensis DSM 12282]